MGYSFRIHGTCTDGTEDSIVISAGSIEEIQEKAKEAAESRGWTDCWSVQL